jgi:hypothetical protein
MVAPRRDFEPLNALFFRRCREWLLQSRGNYRRTFAGEETSERETQTEPRRHKVGPRLIYKVISEV